MNICPKCLFDLSTNYCYRCGRKTIEPEKAKCACGSTLSLRYDRYCEDCGKITALGKKEGLPERPEETV